MNAESKQAKQYYNLYLAQNGHNLSCVVTRETLTEVQQAIHNGIPFGLWFRLQGNVLTGLTLNPVMGGVVCNVSPALRIPITATGQPATNSAEVAKWVEPHEQALGEVTYPGWSNQVQGKKNGRSHEQPPSYEPEQPAVEPPPGPPGT